MRAWILPLLLSPALALAQSLPDKAAKYHAMLMKRPQPGAIMERFTAAWLEDSDLAGLLAFLSSRASQPNATSEDKLLHGLFLVQQADYPGAIAALEAVTKTKPDLPLAWLTLARAQQRIGQTEAALTSLRSIKPTADAATHIAASKLQAQLEARTGHTTEALATLKALAAAHPQEEDLRDEIIDLLLDEGLHSDAIADLTTLLASTKDPYQRVQRRLRLGEIYLRADRREDALAAYGQCLTDAAQDSWLEAEAIARMAAMFQRDDDLIGWTTHLQKLTTQHPQRAAVTVALARAHFANGETEQAIPLFTALLARHPGQPELRRAFIDLLSAAEQWPQALEQLAALRANSPQDRDLLLQQLTLQHRAGQSTARDESIAAYLALPGTGEAEHLTIARLHEQFREPALALKALEAAYAAYPSSTPVTEALAAHLLANNAKQRGLQLYAALIKAGSVEDAIRCGQALMLRREHRQAQDMLTSREPDFATHPRFLATLLQAATANQDREAMQRLSRARLPLIEDPSEVTLALRQVLAAYPDLASLEAALQQPSSARHDRLLRAMLLFRKGEPAAAEQLLLAAPSAELPLALHTMVDLYAEARQTEKAITHLKSLLALPKQRSLLGLQRLIGLHREAGQIEPALALIPEWKKLAPAAITPWMEESKLLSQAQQPEQSLNVLRQAHHRFEDDTTLTAYFAERLAAAGQHAEAIATQLSLYERATDSTDKLRHVTKLAEYAQTAGSMESLLHQFEERQSRSRSDAITWLAMSRLHQQTGNTDQSLRCLYEASRLRPQDHALLLAIAHQEQAAHLPDEALRTLEAAQRLRSTPELRRALASNHLARGDTARAMQVLTTDDHLLQNDPREVETLANLLIANDQWEEALALLNTHAPAFPDDYRLHYLHGVALEELGQTNAAIDTFIAVLGMHREMPGAQVPRVGHVGSFAALPAGTELLFQGWSYGPYTYRITTPWGSKQSGNPLSTGVAVPASLAQCAENSFSHCLTMATELPRTVSQAIEAKLDAAGVAHAKLLVELTPFRRAERITANDLADYPQNLALRAAAIIREDDRSAESLLQSMRLFESDYPELTLSAALIKYSESSAIQEFTLTWLKKRPDLGPRLRENLLANLRTSKRSPAMSELAKLVTQWFNSDKDIAENFHPLLDLNIRHHEWLSAVDLLNRAAELPAATFAKPTQSTRQSSRAMSPRPLNFPFATIPDLHFLDSPDSQFRASLAEVKKDLASEESIKAFIPYLPKLTNSNVRALAALEIAADPKPINEIIAKLLAQPNPTFAQRTLAPWQSQFHGRNVEACERLALLIPEAPDAAAAEPLIAALIWNAQAAEAAEPALKAKLKPLIASALKEPKAANAEQLALLKAGRATATASGYLDSPKAPTPVVTKSKPLPNPYARAKGRSRPRSGERPKGAEAVLAHVKAQEPELAKAVLLTQLRAAADRWLSGDKSSDLPSLLSRLTDEAPKVLEETIAELTASAAKSPQRLAQLAAIAQSRDQPDLALKHYRALFALSPQHPIAMVQLMVHDCSEPWFAAAQALKQLPPSAFPHLFDALHLAMAKATEAPSLEALIVRRRSLATLAVAALKGYPRPAHWLESMEGDLRRIVQTLGDRARIGDRTMWAMGTPAAIKDNALPYPDELLKAHADLCRTLATLRFEEPWAFGRLASLAELGQADPRQVYALALDLIRSSSAKQHGRTSHFRRSELSGAKHYPYPAYFAARHASEKLAPGSFERDVLPLVTGHCIPSQVREVSAYAALFQAAPDAFVKTARQWLGFYSSHEDSDELLRIWEARGLEMPLDEAFIPTDESDGGVAPDVLRDIPRVGWLILQPYVAALKRRRLPDAINALLTKFRDRALGSDPTVRRARFSEALKARTGGTNQSQTTEQQAAYEYVNELIQNVIPQLGFDSLPFFAQDGCLAEPAFLGCLAEPAFLGYLVQSLPEFPTGQQWFELAEATQLFDQPLRLMVGGHQEAPAHPWILRWTARADHLPQSAATTLRQLLIERQPRSLGLDLIAALMGSTETKTDRIVDALLTHQAHVRALDEPGRLQLWKFLHHVAPGTLSNDQREWQALIAPALEVGAQEAAQQLTSLSSVKSWRELPPAFKTIDLLVPALRSLARLDRPTAVKVLHFVHTLKDRPVIYDLPQGHLFKLATVTELLPEIIDLGFRDSEVRSSPRWWDLLAHEILPERSAPEDALVKALFTNTPWMQGVEAFADPAVSDEPFDHSFVRTVCARLPPDALKKAETLLLKIAPTFGRDYCLAVIGVTDLYDDKQIRTRLVKFLEAHGSELPSLAAPIALSWYCWLEKLQQADGNPLPPAKWLSALQRLTVKGAKDVADTICNTPPAEGPAVETLKRFAVMIAEFDSQGALAIVDQGAAFIAKHEESTTLPLTLESPIVQWLTSCAHAPELHQAILNRLDKLGALTLPTERRKFLTTVLWAAEFASNVPHRHIHRAREMGWLGSVAHFDPGIGAAIAADDEGTGSLVSRWFNDWRSGSFQDQDRNRAKVLRQLQLLPSTFGSRTLIHTHQLAIDMNPYSRTHRTGSRWSLPDWSEAEVTELGKQSPERICGVLELFAERRLQLPFELLDFTYPGLAPGIALAKVRTISRYQTEIDECLAATEELLRAPPLETGKLYAHLAMAYRGVPLLLPLLRKLQPTTAHRLHERYMDAIGTVAMKLSSDSSEAATKLRSDVAHAVVQHLASEAGDDYAMLKRSVREFESFVPGLPSPADQTENISCCFNIRHPVSLIHLLRTSGYFSAASDYPFGPRWCNKRRSGSSRIKPLGPLYLRSEPAPDLLGAIAQRLVSLCPSESDRGQALIAALRCVPDPSFGSELIAALLDGPDALRIFVALHTAELNRLSLAERSCIDTAAIALWGTKAWPHEPSPWGIGLLLRN